MYSFIILNRIGKQYSECVSGRVYKVALTSFQSRSKWNKVYQAKWLDTSTRSYMYRC